MEHECLVETKPFVNFTEVCRICLIKSNDMRQLTDAGNPEIGHLLTQLVSVANLNLEISPNLPNFLCWTCEEKLKLSYDFQQLCLRSQEIIKSYLENSSDHKIIFNELVKDEIIKVQNDKYKQKLQKCKSKKKLIHNNNSDYKRTKRLQIIPDEKIREAIKAYKERYGQSKICLICNFLTKNANALAVHMTRKHPSVKESWCYLCNEEFENLSAHKTFHIKTDNKCQFCNKIFPIPQHYLEHLRSHSDTRSFSCKKCNLEYRYRRDLYKHVQIKHKKAHLELKKEKLGEPVLNNINDTSFTLTNTTSEAQQLNKYKADKNELCPHCGKQFTTVYKLNVHMRTHSGVAPYKCRFCDKSTTTIHYLMIHERTHTGEKPYICNYCGKGFAQQSVMSTHRKRHTGETINCTVCDKTFCRKSELKIHMRCHTGEKPYSCEMCGRAFKQRSHLVDHLNTHKPLGDFQCQYCERNFKAKSSLKAHLLIHTGLKPYKCTYCSYECRRNFNLKKHLEQHKFENEVNSEPEIVVNNEYNIV